MDIETIKLVDGVLLVQTLSVKETSGGLIIPDSSQKKPIHGVVKKAGKNDLDISKGYTLVHYQDAGSKITISGEEYLIMKVYDVLAYEGPKQP